MEKFIIQSNDYLSKNIQAYYHLDYTNFGAEGNPDFINHLKNQFGKETVSTLRDAVAQLKEILNEDFPIIKSIHHDVNFTVCVIPRAKAENTYLRSQKLFKSTIAEVLGDLGGFANGTAYIIRKKDTRTTHMDKSGYGGEGDMPYPGITKDTCEISDEVKGKNILLIDDIYTKTINIDEDAIEALLKKGAKSVVFYSIAKTKSKSASLPSSTNFASSNTDDLPF